MALMNLEHLWVGRGPTDEERVRTRLVNAARIIAAVAEHPTPGWEGAGRAMASLADNVTYLLHSRTPGGMYDGAEDAEELPKDWYTFLDAPTEQPKGYYD
jgi:hypothetical protein